MRKPTICVLTGSDTNRPVQTQKTARSLKFRKKRKCTIRVSKTNFDLRLCFRICKLLVFSISCEGSFSVVNSLLPFLAVTRTNDQIPKLIAELAEKLILRALSTPSSSLLIGSAFLAETWSTKIFWMGKNFDQIPPL